MTRPAHALYVHVLLTRGYIRRMRILLRSHFAQVIVFVKMDSRDDDQRLRRRPQKAIAVQNGIIGIIGRSESSFQGHTNFTIEVVCAARTPDCSEPQMCGFVYAMTTSCRKEK